MSASAFNPPALVTPELRTIRNDREDLYTSQRPDPPFPHVAISLLTFRQLWAAQQQLRQLVCLEEFWVSEGTSTVAPMGPHSWPHFLYFCHSI